jgi:hypothetical protein
MAYQGNVISKGALRDWMLQNNRQNEGQSTWQSMYNEVNQQASSQQQAITDAYNESVLQAYDSYLSNKAAIAGSNIIGSGKSTLQKSAQQQLDEAYLTYASNAYESATAVTESQQQALNAITTELDTQAGNYSDYLNKTYDYLTYLWENRDTIDGATKLFNDAKWSKFLTNVLDENGEPTEEMRLLTREELFNPRRDDNNEWLSVFDKEGYLTVRGEDYFDQLLNSDEFGMSYNDWLINNDQELYDWATDVNAYDVTKAGTNLGSLKTAVGLSSTDFTYQFMERWGGLTKSESEALFKDFEDDLAEMQSKLSKAKSKGKEIIKIAKDSMASLNELTDQLDITESLEKTLGYDLSTIYSQMVELYDSAKSNGEMTGEWFKDYGIAAGSGALFGTAAGTIVPGVGNVTGFAAGALIGQIAGIVMASMNTADQREQNKKAAKEATAAYNELLISLRKFANDTQSTVQSNFNASKRMTNSNI